MKNYLQAYLKNRPLFFCLIRPTEAQKFSKLMPLECPVLDFGCGDGFFSRVVFRGQKIDVGLDVNSKDLLLAKKTGKYKKLVKTDGVEIPFPNNYFSTTISNCVLEHVDRLDKSLLEISRVTKRGGFFITSVMANKWNDYLLGGKFGGDYYKKWMKNMQVHKNLLSKRTWERKFENVGFEIISVEGYLSKKTSMWMDFLHYVSLPSLLSYKFFGKWVFWGKIFDKVPVYKLIEQLTDDKVPPNKSAALFYVLKKRR